MDKTATQKFMQIFINCNFSFLWNKFVREQLVSHMVITCPGCLLSGYVILTTIL